MSKEKGVATAINDPALYRKLCEPYESREAVDKPLAAFIDDVRAAREKHGVPDVTILFQVVAMIDGEEIRLGGMHHSGNPMAGLQMLAEHYGRQSALWESELVRLAGGDRHKKPF